MAYDWSGKQHRRIRWAKFSAISILVFLAITCAWLLR
jgi:hypothetical protein